MFSSPFGIFRAGFMHICKAANCLPLLRTNNRKIPLLFLWSCSHHKNYKVFSLYYRKKTPRKWIGAYTTCVSTKQSHMTSLISAHYLLSFWVPKVNKFRGWELSFAAFFVHTLTKTDSGTIYVTDRIYSNILYMLSCTQLNARHTSTKR